MENKIKINEISKYIFEMNKEKGFWDRERNIGEMLMLTVSELGEAMESHRKGKICFLTKEEINSMENMNDSDFKEMFERNVKDTFQDEIADTIIRILDMVEGLNVLSDDINMDLEKHIELKLKYNSSRERLHGKKY
jgi:NTP pyrophosphatase (non-canonical NTP hydrolase)